MKSKKEWDEKFPDMELNQYLQPMDEVDEELHLRCGEIVAPQYLSKNFLQMGDADFKEDGVYFYTTFATYNGKHYYLGILPEFQQ